MCIYTICRVYKLNGITLFVLLLIRCLSYFILIFVLFNLVRFYGDHHQYNNYILCICICIVYPMFSDQYEHLTEATQTKTKPKTLKLNSKRIYTKFSTADMDY